MVEAIGRWSMVDIYVITIMAALVNVGALASFEAGPAAVFFAGVVVLTMFAALSFDPRLIWDVFKLPHHCSYKALGPDKGESKTEPTEQVEWLLEQGQNAALVVSSSGVILDTDQKQPPHFQAKATYTDRADEIDGEFVVRLVGELFVLALGRDHDARVEIGAQRIDGGHRRGAGQCCTPTDRLLCRHVSALF